MSQNEADSKDHDPADSAAHIDRVCDAFEAAWKAGQRPRIEDFVQSSPRSGCKDLFRELLLVELQLRLADGESPVKHEYLSRFPDFVAEIDLAFGTTNVAAGRPRHPPRDSKSNDRSLLFGILAVQLDFIGRDALIAAMNAWVLTKDKPLGEILVEQKALTADRRTLLEALVLEHLKQHDNDPEKSLAAVSSADSVQEDLQQLADPDMQASLVHLSAAHLRGKVEATRNFSVGNSTSAGTRFRILRPHAEGGLGMVSVARDEELSREVALKEIKARHADNPESRARFLLEAEITGGLEHPGVVPVYGLGQYADGRPYYAMRFIRGDSLKEAADIYHHSQSGKSDAGERAVELRKLLGRFIDVCNAIAYAHSRGVLHRDLKPGNIMLGKYGETLVVDWGLAKIVDRPDVQRESSEVQLKPSSGSGSAATQMGSALGTPQYMSPEQAAGQMDQLGPASDVYGLGATLYYVLTGRPPIEASDIGSVLKKVQSGDLRPPRTVNPRVAPPLEAICLKAMRLKPEDRYASPKALADDIERWLADEPVTAYREPLRTLAARWGRKHRTLVAGSFALLTTAAIALVVSTTLIQRAFVSELVARNEADANAKKALENSQRADEQAREAQDQKMKAQRQLALFYIERAIRELQHGEPARGFAILGQAYRAADGANNSSLRSSICALLGAWQSTCEHRLTHDDSVHAVAFSPDGTKIATASEDKTARLWDTVTGHSLCLPMKHDDRVWAVAFSPNGTRVATASEDKTARLWDATTGKPLSAPMKHDGWVRAAAFSPDGTKVATASGDYTARLWDATTGQPLGPPMKHDNWVWTVAFSPDGAKVASASNDHTARLWNAATCRPLGPRMMHDGWVRAVAFSPDGTKIATSDDKMTRLWDAGTCQALGAPMKHDGGAAVAFNPGGTKLATSGEDHTARLWDVATGEPLGAPMKHVNAVEAVAFSPDGTKIATASWDKTARLWDAATCQPLGPPMKHDDGVSAVAFSPDGAKVATASNDHMARLWDVAACRPPTPPMKHDLPVRAVAFSPDGTKIATASWDKTARLWDAVTRQPLEPSIRHDDGVLAVAFSPDGTKIATASWDKTARLWDAATCQPLGPPMKHDDGVSAVAFSPDGAKVATASNDHMARMWGVATCRLLGPPMKHEDLVRSVAFSPDGAKVVTASEDKTARLWDAATCQPLGLPMKHDRPIWAVAFAPDGTKIATASQDKTARLWSVVTCRPLGLPMKHDDGLLAVAFSPDGTKIATASWDTTARLWDAATCLPLGPPMKHDRPVWAVAFSPDGAKVATASEDTTARLWPVSRSLPDDPRWVTAYVDVVSAWKEGGDTALHPISTAETEEAWNDVLKSPAWPNYRRQDTELRAHVWHESEAYMHEAAGNWNAAAFHLRWLCQLEPKTTQWRQRLANVEELLAPSTLPNTSSRLLIKDAQAGTWSPDGKKIAFAYAKPSDNGIHILTLADKNVEELTASGKDPAWSPGDGRFIAFTDKKAGDEEEGIWIADLRSKKTKRVAAGGFASWLADGKTVCFRAPVDGKLVLQSLDVTDDKAAPKTLSTDVWVFPAISPDGQHVAGFGGNGELQIWSVAKQEIVDRYTLRGWLAAGFLPGWSPDSQQVAFGSFAMGVSNDLWTYDLRTHRAKKLLAGPYTLPRWSPDGKRMCVDKRGSGPKELWLLDLK